MFKPILRPANELPPEVDIFVEGTRVRAREGDSVAMALLNAGVHAFRRTPVSGEPRAPLCLMGVCFDCLVAIDGVQNVQSCMTPVRPDMKISLPDGARGVGNSE